MLVSTHEQMPIAEQALGRPAEAMAEAAHHYVLGTPLIPPFPEALERAVFALGCFWPAERHFWVVAGVWTTATGYTGGGTPNPTYEQVCSSKTGHAEAVLVVFDPAAVSYEDLLKVFWESADPTQGMGQGNDIGTQYRSAIYTCSKTQRSAATASRDRYAAALKKAGRGEITTEIIDVGDFYYAEEYHQQYLAKHSYAACALVGTGVPLSGGSVAPTPSIDLGAQRSTTGPA